MRRLVLVLLLANALTFAWHRGWLVVDPAQPGSVEHADRLRPVPLSRLEPPAPPESAPPSSTALATPSASPSTMPSAPPSATPSDPPSGQPVSERMPAPSSEETRGAASADLPPAVPAETGSAPATPEPSAAAAAPAPVCRGFAPIDEERARTLRSALESSGARVDAQRIEQGASYLVYLPPAPTPEEAHQRLLDARRIGRDDAFVIQDGSLRMAISLGLFRFESAARTMVAQLERAGETRALVAARPPIQVRIALQARWERGDAAAIAQMLGTQFDAVVHDCG